MTKEINLGTTLKNKYNLYICKKCDFATDQSDKKICLNCGGNLIKKEGITKKDFK